MRILVVASDIPATTAMPGSPRLFSLSRELSRNHELHLVARCRSPQRLAWFSDDLTARGVFSSLTTLPRLPAAPTWWAKQRHRLRRGAYFETAFLYPEYHGEVRRTIRRVASQEDADLIYVDSLGMAQYVESTPELPALVDLHDSLTLFFSRNLKAEKGWKKKIFLFLQVKEMAKRERSLADRFSLVITNSPVDEATISRLAPSARTLTVRNGVDTEFFKPGSEPVEPKRLLFTGVLSYQPNEDAVLHFCQTILPPIREQVPDVEFWAVGSDPTARVQALAQRPGIHVTGSVPDVRPYLQSAQVFVCPLRWGAGVKNKILAALAMGKPVVATGVSVDGLDLRAGHDLLVADDTESFARQVIRLLENPGYGEMLGQNGQRSVRQRYSWRASADVLEGALVAVLRASDSAGGRPSQMRLSGSS